MATYRRRWIAWGARIKLVGSPRGIRRGTQAHQSTEPCHARGPVRPLLAALAGWQGCRGTGRANRQEPLDRVQLSQRLHDAGRFHSRRNRQGHRPAGLSRPDADRRVPGGNRPKAPSQAPPCLGLADSSSFLNFLYCVRLRNFLDYSFVGRAISK